MPNEPEQEPYLALRTKALESLLIEKGLLSADAIDERIIRNADVDCGDGTSPDAPAAPDPG